MNMLAKPLRFVSLLCAAVALGLTLTHDLEIAGKHSLSGAEWLHVQHTFYGGLAIVGGNRRGAGSYFYVHAAGAVAWATNILHPDVACSAEF
jgi:hypothetical protein